jgi:hypothetical protein
MAKLRLELQAHEKHSRLRYGWRLGFALMCVALLAATWFWATRERPSVVATVDLRHITRGDETFPAPTSITLQRNTVSVRVLLPVGSASGAYEVGVFENAGSNAPIVAGSAETSLDNSDLVLRFALSLRGVKPGSYALGIRHGNSEWAYYSLTID